mgnify:CR=1 FL=1
MATNAAQGTVDAGKRPLRLIFHIGAGKTGTSSIQHTLNTQQDELRRQGYWYLGLMLEHAFCQRHPWQKASASEVFHTMDAAQASEQLTEILLATVADARRDGMHTLIWSNESFFDRNAKTRSALAALQQAGVTLSILAYVRRHDAWARSAYVQWGIKHKTYVGPVQPFGTWIKSRHPRFSAALLPLMQAFPDSLVVRNLDGMGDAVGDFLQLAGLAGAGLNHVRTNETPTGAELFLRALYNNTFRDKVLPVRFDRSMGRTIDFATSCSDYFGQLMPTADDLEAVREQCEEDRQAIDRLLDEQDQPPIETARLAMKPIELDSDALLKSLCQIVVQQSIRLERLEKTLRELNESVNSLPAPAGPDHPGSQ